MPEKGLSRSYKRKLPQVTSEQDIYSNIDKHGFDGEDAAVATATIAEEAHVEDGDGVGEAEGDGPDGKKTEHVVAVAEEADVHSRKRSNNPSTNSSANRNDGIGLGHSASASWEEPHSVHAHTHTHVVRTIGRSSKNGGGDDDEEDDDDDQRGRHDEVNVSALKDGRRRLKQQKMKVEANIMRAAIARYYVDVLGCPHPEAWNGRGAAIPTCMQALSVSRGSRCVVKEVFKRVFNCIQEGKTILTVKDIAGSTQRHRHDLLIKPGSEEERLIADLMEKNFGVRQTTEVVNNYRSTKGLGRVGASTVYSAFRRLNSAQQQSSSQPR